MEQREVSNGKDGQMHHRPKDRFHTENVPKLHEHSSKPAMNIQTCTNTCNEERQEENKQKRERMERCITKHVLLLQKFVQNIISIVKGKNTITEQGRRLELHFQP